MKYNFKPIDTAILILRLSSSLMLLLHGIKKIGTGVSGIGGRLVDRGLPDWIAWGVYLGEVVAPLMVLLGFRTRLAAFVMAVNMVMAVYIAHPDDLLKLTKTGAWAIELQALYFFAALVLIFTGGGKYAISRHKWGD